jgi:hypothetical protein
MGRRSGAENCDVSWNDICLDVWEYEQREYIG